MVLPARVIVKEVGPRDGLQNESSFLATDAKVEFVNRLSSCGFKFIEVTSFVAPKWIPQLADAEEILRRIDRRVGVEYSALVPNERGLERAFRANVDAVGVFISASESHNRKNMNKSIDETFAALKPVVYAANSLHKRVRGYVSTAFGCPYEGDISVEQVLKVMERLLEMGVDEISIGDTIGTAIPSHVILLTKEIAKRVSLDSISLHFHDTHGTAIANVYAGLLSGIWKFDGSIGGLGGCPYAPGASGNVATDDLLYFLHKLGIETGINEALLAETAKWFEDAIGKPLMSHSRAIARGQERIDACG